MTRLKEISVIVPVFNEKYESLLNLNKIDEYMKSRNMDFEIILINDGSNIHKEGLDRIINENKNIKRIDLDKNRGKGYAFKKGVMESKYSHILLTDLDLSAPIEEVEKLEPHIFNNDIVIGSRYKNNNLNRSVPRKIVGLISNVVIKKILVPNINDTQCGFKLFSRKSISKIISKQTIYKYKKLLLNGKIIMTVRLI